MTVFWVIASCSIKFALTFRRNCWLLFQHDRITVQISAEVIGSRECFDYVVRLQVFQAFIANVAQIIVSWMITREPNSLTLKMVALVSLKQNNHSHQQLKGL